MCTSFVSGALCSVYGGKSVVLGCWTSLRNSSSASTFRFSDLEIVPCPENKRGPKPDWNQLVFGAQFSDHMFEVQR